MELSEAMRTNGACRRFRTDDVPGSVLLTAIEDARFGPNGGNRQGVRFIVVRDHATKQLLGEWYGEIMERHRREFEAAATTPSAKAAGTMRVNISDLKAMIEDQDHLSHHMADVPAVVVVVVELESMALTDTALDRPSISGGASVYPIVQNFALALRQQGVGSVITTTLMEYETKLQGLLSIPSNYAVACVMPVGYPERPFPKKLSRFAAQELIFQGQFGQPLDV